MRTLFVSYDGVLAGPGRAQTLPYVRGLASRGHALALLSFEDPALLGDPVRTDAVRQDLGDIPWTTLPRRGSPPRDLHAGLRTLRAEFRRHDADLVHARGYVPAFLARVLHLPFLFDMRAFWPDERVDGGLWSRDSLGYRSWKRIERSLCRRAAAVVTLTERARDEMARLAMTAPDMPVFVIPTCADLDRFRPVPPADRPPEARVRRFLLLGGTGTWYLRDAMLDLAARALATHPDAHVHVLTEDPPGPILEGLDRRGVDPRRRLVRAVPGADVPRWISGAEAAIALIRSTWSKGASCPTKLGELLGCGVPVLVNEGIGDVDRILGPERVGATVKGLDEASYDRALADLAALRAEAGDSLADRCRAVAQRWFDLRTALDRYEQAYAAAGTRTR